MPDSMYGRHGESENNLVIDEESIFGRHSDHGDVKTRGNFILEWTELKNKQFHYQYVELVENLAQLRFQ